MSPPVQELRSAYKLPSHVIANPVRTLGVAIPCRNYRMHTNLQPEIATAQAPRNDKQGTLRVSLRTQCAHWVWQSRAGTIKYVQICSFVPFAAYAVYGDMSPVYRCCRGVCAMMETKDG